MSTYTSQRWPTPTNGHLPYGSFPGEIRGPHEMDRRELRPDLGEFGLRQNGHMEHYIGPSPMTSADSPSYNRSLCNGEEFIRNSPPVAYDIGYSPPVDRGVYFPRQPRRKYCFSRPPYPPRPMTHGHSPPSHVRGWGHYMHRGRRPFFHPERCEPTRHLRQFPRAHGAEHHDSIRGYHGGMHHYADMSSDTHPVTPIDPRMKRQSSVDRIPLLGSSPHDKKVEQINKDHSYCVRTNGKHSDSVKPLTEQLGSAYLSVVSDKTQPTCSLTQPVAVTPTRGVLVQKELFWPVPEDHYIGNFIMDLDPEVEGSNVVVLAEEATGTVSMKDLPSDIKVQNTGEEGKMVTRRSKRLAQAQTDSPTQVELPQSEMEECMEQPSSQTPKPEVRKSKRRSRKMLNLQSERKAKKLARQNRKATNKSNNSKSIEGRMPVELKQLLSGDFTPEILTTRSRGESITLARRQVMAEEMEQHERERLQTAMRDTDTEDSGVAIDTANATDTSSEYSATNTISSTQTMSRDQGSSHDLDSFLDAESFVSSDSALEEFSPELIARCKRISTARSSGDTPMHKVCRSGKIDMVRCLLLGLKVNPNVADNAGWTPLHEACCNNRPIIVNLLLRSGADANASARDGTRPIHDAVEIGALEIVRSLLEHGADPTAELGDKTPLDIAKAQKQMAIYDYLLPVVAAHKERMKALKAATASPAVKTGSTRARVKKVKSEDDVLTLPVDGYGSDDGISFGKELDFPLFYICPVLELSESPMLPVYNFEIVAGTNPRRHNFYLLSELLQSLGMTESELRRKFLEEISALEMTVGEFLNNLKHHQYNRHVQVPDDVKGLSKYEKIKFLPVCSQLRELLDIHTVNLDD